MPHHMFLRSPRDARHRSGIRRSQVYQRRGLDCIGRIRQLNVTSPDDQIRRFDGPPLRLSHTDRADHSCAPYPRPDLHPVGPHSEDAFAQYQLIPNQHCVQSGRSYLENTASKGNLINSSLTKITFSASHGSIFMPHNKK